MIQSAFLEPEQEARQVVPELLQELRHMQAWRKLDRIDVGGRGDLAAMIRRSVRAAAHKRLMRE